MLTKLLTDTLYVVLPKVLPLSVLFPALAPAGGGGGGELALIFSGYVPLASQTPYSIIVRWSIIDLILVTFGQIFNFRDPNLVTFCFYELTLFLDLT